MSDQQLELKDQICFPIYSVSRLITRLYKPLLSNLGLTYPQYLVLMVLWEADGLSINQIKEKLLLDTNTLSPLLKRIEAMGFITRTRSITDERSVTVELTEAGRDLKLQALPVPEKMLENLLTEDIDVDAIMGLREMLKNWINILQRKIHQT